MQQLFARYNIDVYQNHLPLLTVQRVYIISCLKFKRRSLWNSYLKVKHFQYNEIIFRVNIKLNYNSNININIRIGKFNENC